MAWDWNGNWMEVSLRLKGRVLGVTQMDVDPANPIIPLYWLALPPQ